MCSSQFTFCMTKYELILLLMLAVFDFSRAQFMMILEIYRPGVIFVLFCCVA